MEGNLARSKQVERILLSPVTENNALNNTCQKLFPRTSDLLVPNVYVSQSESGYTSTTIVKAHTRRPGMQFSLNPDAVIQRFADGRLITISELAEEMYPALRFSFPSKERLAYKLRNRQQIGTDNESSLFFSQKELTDNEIFDPNVVPLERLSEKGFAFTYGSETESKYDQTTKRPVTHEMIITETGRILAKQLLMGLYPVEELDREISERRDSGLGYDTHSHILFEAVRQIWVNYNTLVAEVMLMKPDVVIEFDQKILELETLMARELNQATLDSLTTNSGRLTLHQALRYDGFSGANSLSLQQIEPAFIPSFLRVTTAYYRNLMAELPEHEQSSMIKTRDTNLLGDHMNLIEEIIVDIHKQGTIGAELLKLIQTEFRQLQSLDIAIFIKSIADNHDPRRKKIRK